MRNVLVFFSFLLPLYAFGDHDHGKATITTSELDLTYEDHILSGTVDGREMRGTPLESAFGLKLWHKVNDKEYVSIFRSQNNKIAGAFDSEDPSGAPLSTILTFHEIDSSKGVIKGIIGEKNFMVEVTSDTMDGHHYVNPNFRMTFSDDLVYEFTLQNGEACIGCAVKISYAIITMLYSVGIV